MPEPRFDSAMLDKVDTFWSLRRSIPTLPLSNAGGGGGGARGGGGGWGGGSGSFRKPSESGATILFQDRDTPDVRAFASFTD